MSYQLLNRSVTGKTKRDVNLFRRSSTHWVHSTNEAKWAGIRKSSKRIFGLRLLAGVLVVRIGQQLCELRQIAQPARESGSGNSFGRGFGFQFFSGR